MGGGRHRAGVRGVTANRGLVTWGSLNKGADDRGLDERKPMAGGMTRGPMTGGQTLGANRADDTKTKKSSKVPDEGYEKLGGP